MNNKENKCTDDNPCTPPIIFDLSNIAGLFFNDEAANELLNNNFIGIENIITIDNERATILIGLVVLTGEYYELKFSIVTTRGVEYLNIFDDIDNLDINHIKKWMHITLCDEYRKINLIADMPENYEFNGSLFLA